MLSKSISIRCELQWRITLHCASKLACLATCINTLVMLMRAGCGSVQTQANSMRSGWSWHFSGVLQVLCRLGTAAAGADQPKRPVPAPCCCCPSGCPHDWPAGHSSLAWQPCKEQHGDAGGFGQCAAITVGEKCSPVLGVHSSCTQ